MNNRGLRLPGQGSPDSQWQVGRDGRAAPVSERGMVTAEYAVGILAAVAFALVLYSVVTDDQTKNALLRVVIDWMGQLSAFLPK